MANVFANKLSFFLVVILFALVVVVVVVDDVVVVASRDHCADLIICRIWWQQAVGSTHDSSNDQRRPGAVVQGQWWHALRSADASTLGQHHPGATHLPPWRFPGEWSWNEAAEADHCNDQETYRGGRNFTSRVKSRKFMLPLMNNSV